jgi:hypothetical protein
MRKMICCEACGTATSDYDIVNYASVGKGSRKLCNWCYNTDVASMLGLDEFGDCRLKPISILDCTGENHEFHFRMLLRGERVEVAAFELEDDVPAGHRFQLLGGVEDNILALVGRLVERIRRHLAVKYLLQDEGGLRIAHQTVCGRIEWDDEALEARVPMLVIDGRKVSWEQFGRMLMTFEGWQFRMKIVDASVEV